MKRIITIALTCIIGLSMTMAPTIMEGNAYADDTLDQAEAAQQAADQLETEQPETEDPAVAEEGVTDAETVDEDTAAEDTDVSPEAETAVTEDDEQLSAMSAEGEGTESGELTTAEGTPFEGLAGMYVSDLENDPERGFVLEDPTFYRYYEIGEDGLISEKHVELDEVEAFLQSADANAEGIEDTDNVETNGDITAMGGGVTGLGKGQTPSKYRSHNRYHCIDISWWQGKVSDANWKKIKAAGVTHAIIRCGYSTLRGGQHNMDSTFGNNLNGAYKAGIKVGVYYYSTAVSSSEAKSEAQYVVSLLKNYKSKITLPVAYDYETGGRLTAKVMRNVGTASCTAFCDTIKAAGYTPMVYANYNTLTNYINYRTLQGKYKIWLANYTTNGVATTYAGDYWMWQYSSSGRVNGLKGNIDINYIFEPKAAPKTTTTTAKPAASAKTTTATKAAATKKAPAFKSYTAKTKTKLKYRTGPGKKYKVKGIYKKGAKIKIVGKSGSWLKVSNGYYVSAKFVKKIKTAAKKKYPYTAKTTTDVNYRTSPSTKGKIKGTYGKGTKVTIKSEKNGWGLMSNGYYIYLKYIKK